MSLFDLTALELGAKIQAGEVGAVEATRACLVRIEAKEPTVHAFVTVTPEAAVARAEDVQKRIQSGELTHPLAGVPLARSAWERRTWMNLQWVRPRSLPISA